MRALVTGASRGIGRAIAEALVRDGYEVIGTARRPEALSDAERVPGVRYLPLDLGDESGIAAVARAAGDVDVLVSNAGQSQIGAIEEVPLERARAIFQTNLFGAMSLIQKIIPGMRARRQGTVIGIASFAAVTPVPFQSIYASSKAAFVALHTSLRHEVRPWGIRVAVVAPLDINTTIPLEDCCGEGSPYAPLVAAVRSRRDAGLAAAPGPEVVARTVMRVLHARRPRLFSVAGRGAWRTGFLAQHLPSAVVERVVRGRYGLT